MAAAFRAACMGDLDTVKSCLEGVDAMDINEVDEDDATGWPLLLCAVGGDTGQGRVEGHLDVARYVLSRGADIHFRDEESGETALLLLCSAAHRPDEYRGEIVDLLLRAGAAPDARNAFGYTPLGKLLGKVGSPVYGECIKSVRSLLRAGATLDLCGQRDEDDVADVDISAEKILDIREEELRGFSGRHVPVNFGEFTAVKNLVTGVRAAGSFKRYVREPHREVLALRGLAMRGHLVPRRRTRGAAEWKAAVAFLVRLGDNGVVWNVLSFWRATE